MKKHIHLFAPVLLSATSAVSVHAQVQTNTPPAVPEKPKAVWKSSVAAGLTITSGNSETTLATVGADTSRKTDHNEWSLGVDGAYGKSKVSGQTETTTTRGVASWIFAVQPVVHRTFLWLRSCGRTARRGGGPQISRIVEPWCRLLFHQEYQHRPLHRSRPGYVFQQQDNETTRYAALRVGEKFHQALSDRARLWQTAEWAPQVDRFNNYIINAELGVEADLTKDKKLALRSYVTDTFNNEPAPGRKQNDLTWVTAIAYKF